MSRFNFKGMILLFLFAIYINTMKAQENNKTQHTLNKSQQAMATIAILTAKGDQQALEIALEAGLNAGLEINPIKEAMVQLYAYCGFPRSLNALNTFKRVLDTRLAKGIQDKQGKPVVTENNNIDKYEQGRKVLEELTKTPQQKPAPGFGEFAPRADLFLKEHLFADIFSSDVLIFSERELVTISALAAMQDVEPQLKAHIAMGRNTGITDAQLAELAAILEKHIGKAQANNFRKTLGLAELPLIQPDMMVRIAEIEIEPAYLEQYKAILKEQSFTAIRTEPGVISIFPMYQKDKPNVFRLVEIYSSKEAYDSHIRSIHFQKYKSSTLKMVKSLKLVDMDALSSENMQLIFEKIGN